MMREAFIEMDTEIQALKAENAELKKMIPAKHVDDE
jgi:hypothetical protein